MDERKVLVDKIIGIWNRARIADASVSRTAHERMKQGYDKDREVREAIDAGEQALRSLKTAREKLNSAGNWGHVFHLSPP